MKEIDLLTSENWKIGKILAGIAGVLMSSGQQSPDDLAKISGQVKAASKVLLFSALKLDRILVGEKKG
jgi:hypothetical protein